MTLSPGSTSKTAGHSFVPHRVSAQAQIDEAKIVPDESLIEQTPRATGISSPVEVAGKQKATHAIQVRPRVADGC
jgi:hypothetical protein